MSKYLVTIAIFSSTCFCYSNEAPYSHLEKGGIEYIKTVNLKNNPNLQRFLDIFDNDENEETIIDATIQDIASEGIAKARKRKSEEYKRFSPLSSSASYPFLQK